MAKRMYFFLLYLTVFSHLLTSCQSLPAMPELPDVGIPAEEINKRIKLIAPQEWNTFKTGEVIGISVEVISEDQIAFQHDYDVLIFALKDREWVEVPNLMNYPEGYVLLSKPNGEPFKRGDARVDPILPDLDKNVTVRIIIVGNIYRDGQITEDQTAAYIDLELKP